MNFLEEENGDFSNIRTVNECEAVAISAGYHLATGNYGVVYTQSDGFAKCINPLTSLTDDEVYGIPLLLIIGWRGEPGTEDAEQHRKIGEILPDLLELLEIPYETPKASLEEFEEALENSRGYMEENSEPFAIIIKKGVFEEGEPLRNGDGRPSREEALKTVIDSLSGMELIVSTTGKLSRELYELREKRGETHEKDFYNVGAMGCAQSIGLGIARQREDEVFVLDGDGSVLMQMGALATNGNCAPENFHHVIFDNYSHDSTGGQRTSSETVSFDEIAKACNYNLTEIAENRKNIEDKIHDVQENPGPSLLVVKVKRGARYDLGRPSIPLQELKKQLKDYLEK